MGCGTSKAAAVMVASTTKDPQANRSKVLVESGSQVVTGSAPASSVTQEKEIPRTLEETTVPGLKRDVKCGSCESLLRSDKTVVEVSRQSSAKSKDSGLGVDTEPEHSSSVKSSPFMRSEADTPQSQLSTSIKINKKMSISGQTKRRKRNPIRLPPIKPIAVPKAKEDVELEAILQKRVKFADTLINELPATNSIVKRPVSRGGVAFDIMVEHSDSDGEGCPGVDEMSGRVVPQCVRNYAKRQRQADIVTKTKLEQKQRAAEERRKASLTLAIPAFSSQDWLYILT